jgi:transposase
MASILDLFCDIDDFCQTFLPTWQQTLVDAHLQHRHRTSVMHPSEILTLLVHFHHSGYRTFKHYYQRYVATQLQREFPQQLSYGRLIEVIPSLLVPLAAYLTSRLAACTGLSFVDSSALKVCQNPRIGQHRVFAAIAQRGKTSVGWFYGFKLHLVITDQGELIAFTLTPGNVDDRQPLLQLTRDVVGKLVGDKGYLSQPLAQWLLVERGIELVTKVRKNMVEPVRDELDKLLLRKRAVIESVFDFLKNICQIEHSRHRSPANFLGHLLAGLVAYTHLPAKPSLHLQWLALPAA